MKYKEIPCLSSKDILRFMSYFSVNDDGCWVWQSAISPSGYPRFGIGRCSQFAAHRIAVALANRQLQRHLTVDHLCRNRSCVNPDHLEVIPLKENVLRGYNPFAVNARKTKCKNGHELSGKNLIKQKTGKRNCRKCGNDRSLNYYHAKKQEAETN